MASALVQPKKPAGGAFGQFMAEKRADFIKQTAGKPISEAQKLAGAAWKALTDAEKAPYQKKYEDATVKYKQDFEAFTAAGGVKTLGVAALRSEKKKAKESKSSDKDAKLAQKAAKAEAGCPKKPMTPCFAYIQDHRKEISEHEDVKGKGLGAISQKGAELFKALPEAERAVYDKKYEEGRKQFEEWNKSEAGLAFHAKQKEAAKEEKAAAKAAAQEEKIAAKAAAKEGKADAKEEKAAAKTSSPVAKKAKVAAAEDSAKTPGKRGRGASAGAKTPAKSGGGRGRGRSAGSAAQPSPAIDADVLADAAKQGFEAQLKNLASRPEVVASGKSAREMLACLTKSGGLVNPAKAALLGA